MISMSYAQWCAFGFSTAKIRSREFGVCVTIEDLLNSGKLNWLGVLGNIYTK